MDDMDDIDLQSRAGPEFLARIFLKGKSVAKSTISMENHHV